VNKAVFNNVLLSRFREWFALITISQSWA